MPALSNGNTCWGNRKAFNFHTEYISDNFLFDLGEVSEDFSSAPTPGQNFVSSNSYYGYHRVPDPPVHEKMSVDECAQASFDGHDRSASSRKRPNTQEENDIVKRIRHQDIVMEVYCNSRCDILNIFFMET